MSIRFFEGYFPSHNQKSQVYYCHYTPDMPRAVVLIIHGMGSYAGRYDSFARMLCENGYAVYAYDLVGHGRSVSEGEIFGSFAEKDGDVTLVKDLETLTALVRRRFRQLPFFVFAHSLGSCIARAFASSHPNVFDGMLLSGAVKHFYFSFFKKRKLNKAIAKAGRTPSREVEALVMGDLVAPFLKEEGSWLTTDIAMLPQDDPYCGRAMCADAYGDMLKLISYISSDECLEATPRAMPILFLAGERDPLGGEALRELCDEMEEMEFSKVTLTVYPGEKHELLFSRAKDTVVRDVLAFLGEESDAVVLLRRQMREVL